MTDNETNSATPDLQIHAQEVDAETTAVTPSHGEELPTPSDGASKSSHKALWAGVGIGSAALVAALMYASKRPKRRGQ